MKCLAIIPFRNPFPIIYEQLYEESCIGLRIECENIYNRNFEYFFSDQFKIDAKNSDILIVDVSDGNPIIAYLLGYVHSLTKKNVIISCDQEKYTFPKSVERNYDIFFYKSSILNDIEEKECYIEALKKRINKIINSKNDPYLVVKQFYNHISNKRYFESWECLTLDFKKRRWFNGFELFEIGYENSHKIDNISIRINEIHDNSKRYTVSYTELSKVHYYNDIENIGGKRFRELKSIMVKINNLKKSFKKKGFNPTVIDELTLNQLISPDRTNIIHWLLLRDKVLKNEIKSSELKGVNNFFGFPEKSSKTFYAYSVLVIKDNEQWLIQEIIPWQSG